MVVNASNKSKLVTYAIRDIVLEAKALEKTGIDMVYLNVGDPAPYGFHPPDHVLNAVRKALDAKITGYAPSEGDADLRQAIAVSEGIAPSDVFVTAGSSEGIDFSFTALLDAGDNILLPSPCYPLYITKQKMCGATPNYYDCVDDWEPDLESIRKNINAKTKAIVVINPNNPTGAVYSRNTLKEIISIAGEHKLPIFSDNAYDLMAFDGCPDIRKLHGDVPLIVGGSMSKNFLYPGARVGWLAFHGTGMDSVKDAIQRLCNQRLSINWEMQKGAIAALQGGTSHLQKMNVELQKRTHFVSQRVSEIDGISLIAPKGAFYAFIKINSNKWKDDWAFCRDLLKQGVVTVPGSGFSPVLDGPYFRIVLLPPIEILDEAFNRIEKVLKSK